jgi:tetratricopeptide (TPR) repeat protein
MTETSKNYLNESKHLHEKALQIYEHLQGRQHKFYAGTLMTYSMVLRHVGEIETALAHCTEAVRIYRSSGHIAWPRAVTWLADIYFAKKQFEVAKDYLEQAIKGDAQFGTTMISPGAFHPQALLAEALLKTGPKEKGLQMLKECIEDWKKKGIHPKHYWVVRAEAALKRGCEA